MPNLLSCNPYNNIESNQTLHFNHICIFNPTLDLIEGIAGHVWKRYMKASRSAETHYGIVVS